MNDKDAWKSEELQRLKVKHMKHMKKCQEKEPEKKCQGVLGKTTKAIIVGALIGLGHTIHSFEKVQNEILVIPAHVSIEETTLRNITSEMDSLRKELQVYKDTMNNLLLNNPTNPTQPYSKEFWMTDQVEKAGRQARGEPEPEKGLVRKSSRSKKGKKGGYLTEHFSLTF